MARLPLLAGGLGVIALVVALGARAIGAEVWLAAWTVPLCVALHALQLWLSALAWRGVCAGAPPRLRAWWRIRWVREAVNSMLPVAQIGGNVVGVRLLAAAGPGQPGTGQARAAAGTVLDLTAEAASQAIFTLAGIGVLAAAVPGHAWAAWLSGGTLALVVGVGGFAAAQRLGLLRLIEAAAARLARHLPGLDLTGLQAAFARQAGDRAALARAVLLHLTAWVLGVGETWLVLAAIGPRPAVAAAFAIEALGMAARSAGFAVPAALGVQEAGFVLVCAPFGIGAETAVALSMVKRARELIVGAGGLLAWQASEGFWRRPRVRADRA